MARDSPMFQNKNRSNLKKVILFGIAVSVFYLVYTSCRHGRHPSSWPIVKDIQKPRGCMLPKLEMYPIQLKGYIKDRKHDLFPKPQCSSEENWISIKNGTFQFSNNARSKYGDFKCSYTPLIRNGDFKFIIGEVVEVLDGSSVSDTVFNVTCASNHSAYENIHIAVPFKDSVKKSTEKRLPEGALGLNVLIFGFDSVSRMAWMRKLPKTYDYFENILGGVVLEGYNIVGDGTPAALLPILTGQTEEELPEARRGHHGAKPVDNHTWIWPEFKEAGYVTQWVEDAQLYGTFTYRMLGFQKQPTDYYTRHFYLALAKSKYGNDKYCLKSEYKHNIMLNCLAELFSVYENSRKFAFGFHGELSHDDNNALSVADDDLRKWLKSLNENGFLKNTLLFLFADHGARFANLRETEQGKQEERNAFMGLAVPDWFKNKYTNAYDNLRANSKRLTTPFDMHATLRHLLGKTTTFLYAPERAYSLFDAIPDTRTCEHAQIAPHWCNCLKWDKLPVDLPEVRKAAKAFVDLLNSLTEKVRKKCHTLDIDKIVSAVSYEANPKMLKFKGAKDFDGRVADLTSQTKPVSNIYQLTIHTQPGDGHFETTVKHNLVTDTFNVDKADISRTNKYGNDPACVMDQLPYLRQFCYCKKPET